MSVPRTAQRLVLAALALAAGALALVRSLIPPVLWLLAGLAAAAALVLSLAPAARTRPEPAAAAADPAVDPAVAPAQADAATVLTV